MQRGKKSVEFVKIYEFLTFPSLPAARRRKKKHNILKRVQNPLHFWPVSHYNDTILKIGGMGVGELIAVLSGKGGTGKTSVLRRYRHGSGRGRQERTAVHRLRHRPEKSGYFPGAERSWGALLPGREPARLCPVESHPASGVPGPSILTAPFPPGDIETCFPAFAAMLRAGRRAVIDYVLLDAPPQASREGFRLAARYAGRILLVTGRTPPSGTQAARERFCRKWARTTSASSSTGSTRSW